MVTAKNAKATEIYFLNSNKEIVKGNLYDFVMLSAEPTEMTREGLQYKMVIKEVKANEIYDVIRLYRGLKYLKYSFKTLEEAKDCIFNYVLFRDFVTNDKRNCYYTYTKQDISDYLLNA